jgi:hypothetical protein
MKKHIDLLFNTIETSMSFDEKDFLTHEDMCYRMGVDEGDVKIIEKAIAEHSEYETENEDETEHEFVVELTIEVKDEILENDTNFLNDLINECDFKFKFNSNKFAKLEIHTIY